VRGVYEAGLLSSERWWTLLGDIWTMSDNLGRYAEWLKPKFRRASRLRLHMMNKANRNVYDRLPETLTVYRGCFPKGEHGMSWTLDKEIARKFPSVTVRARITIPTVLCTMCNVPKTECVYFGERSEQEIVLARHDYPMTTEIVLPAP
jgi:hypothetical protein